MRMGKLAMQPVCMEVLRSRYAHVGETSVDDVLKRVAGALSALEAPGERTYWRHRFLWAMRHGLVPAGRILAGAGHQGMLINCFVIPIDGPGKLNDAMAEAITTLRMGGGVGYDFSPLAPMGTHVQTCAGGPLSAIHELDEACGALDKHRDRRGAQMAVLRCDHPDILSFVHAKDQAGLPRFNLSVAISDAFMQALESDAAVALVHASKPSGALPTHHPHLRGDGMWVHESVRARTVWQEIMRSAYDHGEPGVLFIDRINDENNLSYCEQIRATNPCGEQPLPPYGACCLGAIDLTRLIVDPFGPRARLDLSLLGALVEVAVRLLDNVLDLSTWPLDKQMQEAEHKRRIGLGITGLGDALVMLGLRYDASIAREQAALWMSTIRDAAYLASSKLAALRGAFPRFDADELLKPPHCASRLPADIKGAIRRQGLRHSHLLSVAPAGAISLALCDNVSSGIEPVFAWQMQRGMARGADPGLEARAVEDHAWRLHRHLRGADAAMGDAFMTAHDIAPADHVAMAAAVAPFVDGGISKTVNVRDDLPWAEFEKVYMQAWRAGLKGLTTYRQNAILPPPLRRASPCGMGQPSC